MSLTAALGSARSSLMASGVQSSVISRNIAGASELGYSRKNRRAGKFPRQWRLRRGDPACRECRSFYQRADRDLGVHQAERDL